MDSSTKKAVGIGAGIIGLIIGIGAAIGLAKAAEKNGNGNGVTPPGVTPPGVTPPPGVPGSKEFHCKSNPPMEFTTSPSFENHPCYTYRSHTFDLGAVKMVTRIQWKRLNLNAFSGDKDVYEASVDMATWTPLAEQPAITGYYSNNPIDIKLPNGIQARYIRAKAHNILESRVLVEWT